MGVRHRDGHVLSGEQNRPMLLAVDFEGHGRVWDFLMEAAAERAAKKGRAGHSP